MTVPAAKAAGFKLLRPELLSKSYLGLHSQNRADPPVLFGILAKLDFLATNGFSVRRSTWFSLPRHELFQLRQDFYVKDAPPKAGFPSNPSFQRTMYYVNIENFVSMFYAHPGAKAPGFRFLINNLMHLRFVYSGRVKMMIIYF